MGEASLVARAGRPRESGEADERLVAVVARRVAFQNARRSVGAASADRIGILAGFTFAASPHVLRSHQSSLRQVI
jgi:hypothetical protein